MSTTLYKTKGVANTTGSMNLYVTTLAGTGISGSAGDGGPPSNANLTNPTGIVMDSFGNIFIGDRSNQKVRFICNVTNTYYGVPATAGKISTIVGTGTAGATGDGGPPLSATLYGPQALCLDSNKNLLILEYYNQRVRFVCNVTGKYYGIPATAGNVYTIAATGDVSQAMCLDSNENIYFSCANLNKVQMICKVTGTYYGIPATVGNIYTIASGLSNNLVGLVIDFNGNLLMGFWNNNLRFLCKVTGTYYGVSATAGNIYTVPFTISPVDVTLDQYGNVYISEPYIIRSLCNVTGKYYGVSQTAGNIYTIAGTGVAGTPTAANGDGGLPLNATFYLTLGSSTGKIFVGSNGNIYIADYNDYKVRIIYPSKYFYSYPLLMTLAGSGSAGFAGDNGPANAALFNNIYGVFVDSAGNVFIADASNYCIRFISKSGGTWYGIPTIAGNIYTIAGNGTSGASTDLNGDGGAPTNAILSGIQSIYVDLSGNVFIADYGDNKVRFICNSTGNYYGVAATAGNIYTIAGTGIAGASGDNGPPTNATLNLLTGVFVDSTGNVFIADLLNNKIRFISKSGGTYYGVATTAGRIYTIAGTGTAGSSGDKGLPVNALLNNPQGVYKDSTGNVFIVDSNNNKIRFICNATGTYYGVPATSGNIYTIAGNGTAGTPTAANGDGGAATNGSLNGPTGVWVDSNGNILIADYYNNKIRLVSKATGTYYGVSTTTGNIYTIAGTGVAGITGSGGFATNAQITKPSNIFVDSKGNLHIIDLYRYMMISATGKFLPYNISGNGFTITTPNSGYYFQGIDVALYTPSI